MNRLAAFDAFCAALPGTRMVVQWGGSHVHKVGPKLFALGGGGPGAESFVFKATSLSWEILREQGLASRAPYLPRGNWLLVAGGALADEDLFAHVEASYRQIAARLTRAERARLGLD